MLRHSPHNSRGGVPRAPSPRAVGTPFCLYPVCSRPAQQGLQTGSSCPGTRTWTWSAGGPLVFRDYALEILLLGLLSQPKRLDSPSVRQPDVRLRQASGKTAIRLGFPTGQALRSANPSKHKHPVIHHPDEESRQKNKEGKKCNFFPILKTK